MTTELNFSKAEIVGINTYYFEWDISQEWEFSRSWNELEKLGTVTEIFVNNKLALEVKLNKVIDI